MRRGVGWMAALAAVCLWVGGCTQVTEEAGTVVEVDEIEPGEECAAGGERVTIGEDHDDDGALSDDEVDDQFVVCDGEDGEAGADAPEALVETVDSAECPAGGTVVRVGVDEDGDGELSEDEISEERQICEGEDGRDGDDLLVEESALPMESECAYGGTRVEVGHDIDGDGELSTDEVESDLYHCYDWMPSVAAGHEVSCGLGEAGEVTCWGDDARLINEASLSGYRRIELTQRLSSNFFCGQRPNGTLDFREYPYSSSSQRLRFPSGIVEEFDCGSRACCSVDTAGALDCWPDLESDGPLETPPSGRFKHVARGYEHSCAIDEFGEIECWGGRDDFGEKFPPSGSFYAVSAGHDYSCGIETSGDIACWGHENLKSPPSGPFVALTSGSTHSCGIREDGSVECWGDHGEDVLDAPSGTFVQISAGWEHTCGVKTDRSIECWGSNDRGESDPPSDFP